MMHSCSNLLALLDRGFWLILQLSVLFCSPNVFYIINSKIPRFSSVSLGHREIVTGQHTSTLLQDDVSINCKEGATMETEFSESNQLLCLLFPLTGPTDNLLFSVVQKSLNCLFFGRYGFSVR